MIVLFKAVALFVLGISVFAYALAVSGSWYEAWKEVGLGTTGTDLLLAAIAIAAVALGSLPFVLLGLLLLR